MSDDLEMQTNDNKGQQNVDAAGASGLTVQNIIPLEDGLSTESASEEVSTE